MFRGWINGVLYHSFEAFVKECERVTGKKFSEIKWKPY